MKTTATKPGGSHALQQPWMMVMIVTVLGGCILYLLSRLTKMDRTVSRLEREQQHALRPEELRDAVAYYMRENPEEVMIGCTPYLQRMLLRYPGLYVGPVNRVIQDVLPSYMAQCQNTLQQSVLSAIPASSGQDTYPSNNAQYNEPSSVQYTEPASAHYSTTATVCPQPMPTYDQPSYAPISVQAVPTRFDSADLLFRKEMSQEEPAPPKKPAAESHKAAPGRPSAHHRYEDIDVYQDIQTQFYCTDQGDHGNDEETSIDGQIEERVRDTIPLSAKQMSACERLQLDALPVVDSTAENARWEDFEMFVLPDIGLPMMMAQMMSFQPLVGPEVFSAELFHRPTEQSHRIVELE